MSRLLPLFTLLWSWAAPLAHAENQIWTTTALRKALSGPGPHEASLDIRSRHHPDGAIERLELRPGLAFRLADGISVAGGYYWGHTNRPGPDRNEHRLWQQIAYDLPGPGRFDISGRTRIEQRRREHFDQTGMRVRQRILLSWPLAGTDLSLRAGPEVFVELSDTDWGARQGVSEMRTEAGLEWRVSETLALSFGYLNQAEFVRSGPDSMDHHVTIGLSRRF